jgi:Flp pilus assembly protein TadG
MVEFAMVASVLFLLLLGIFEAGRIIFTLNSVSNGAREGAHWAAINPPGATIAATYPTTVTSAIAPTLFLIDTSNATNYRLDVTVPGTWSTCIANPSCSYPPITVTVGTTVTLLVPLPGIGSRLVFTSASTTLVER